MAQGKVVAKPLRQGDLDGLCGVYASINAILRHHPCLDDYEKQCQLFKAVVGPVYGIDFINDGAEINEVLKVMEVLKKTLSDFYSIRLQYKTFKNIDTTKSFLDWIKSQKIDFDKQSLVFGFDGRDSHWSVIRGLTRDYAILFDSWEYSRFKLSDFVWSPADDKTKVIVPTTDLILVW